MSRIRVPGVIVSSFVIAAVVGATSAARPAMAADAKGVWQRTDGAARIQFSPCGANLCGTIVWLKDPNGPGKVGQQVFFDMAPSGDSKWTGSAFNPQDNKTYAGNMTLAGNRLTTQGCALGGMICKTFTWSRH